MAKGYSIARLEITDQAKYDACRAVNGPDFRKYGGRFLVRGGAFERKEGEARSRNVVLEFPAYQATLDCYNSPELPLPGPSARAES